jgi:hypothetical protein
MEGEVGDYPFPAYMWTDATLVEVALFLGILLTAIEDRNSPTSVRYEVGRVTELMSSLMGQEAQIRK